MSNKQQPDLPQRRDFLKRAGLGAGAAAAVATGVAVEATAAETPVQPEGYRETAHIKRYYALAKQF